MAETLDTWRDLLTLDMLQEEAFHRAYSETLSEGGTEEEATARGFRSAVMARGRLVPHQYLMRPGKYEPQSGSGVITPRNIEDTVYVINRRWEAGVPVPLKYDHTDDKRAIPLGIMGNAIIEKEGAAYADLYILQDAIGDLDGQGSRTILTIDQIADAVLTGSMKLSIEAWRDVKSPSYYGDRTISLEPAAWAVLPAGVMPAVPDHPLAAGRGQGEPEIFSQDSLIEAEEGGVKMTLEEAQKKIEELTAENEKLRAELDELKEQAKEKAAEEDPGEDDGESSGAEELQARIEELEAQLKEAQETIAAHAQEKEEQERAITEQRVEELKEIVHRKLVAGRKEVLEKELEELDGPAEKLAVLSRLNAILPDLEPEDEQVRTRQKSPDESRTASLVAAAVAKAEADNIPFTRAYKLLAEEGKE